MLQVRIARFPASSAGVGEQSIAHSPVTSLPVPALDFSIGALAGPKGHRNGSSRELLVVGTTAKGCRAHNNPITLARGCAGRKTAGAPAAVGPL